MKKIITKKKEIYFQCEICKLLYNKGYYAKKCEEWCKKNNSCSLDVTKHRVRNSY